MELMAATINHLTALDLDIQIRSFGAPTVFFTSKYNYYRYRHRVHWTLATSFNLYHKHDFVSKIMLYCNK